MRIENYLTMVHCLPTGQCRGGRGRITNLAWGDAAARTLYTTGPTMLLRLRVAAEGLRP